MGYKTIESSDDVFLRLLPFCREVGPMNHIGRRFGLSDVPGAGIWCDENSLSVGGVSLVERAESFANTGRWEPRPLSEINRELSKRYGLPVDFGSKVTALEGIARALARGDLLHAQIVALHMAFPDPPPPDSEQTAGEVFDLALKLRASGLLKADWDPAKNPRVGAPPNPGWFAPADGAESAGSPDGRLSAPVIPAQIPFPIPAPFELPVIPFPSEIVPAPVIPNISPRDLPRILILTDQSAKPSGPKRGGTA